MNCATSSAIYYFCDANIYDIALLDWQLHFPWVTEKKMELVDNRVAGWRGKGVQASV